MKLALKIKGRGFTLVELMVVLSIIAILSAIVYSNYTNARTDARNKSMRSVLRETQLALETYRAQNSFYPSSISSLQPDFMSVLPVAADSANTNCSISYQVGSGGAWYKLTAERCLGGFDSATEGVQTTDELARCPTTCSTCTASSYTQASPYFYESIAVYSSGGQCQ